MLATEQGVKEVENGVSLATRARGSLEQIIQMVDRTTQAIRQITFATQQQQSASEQIVQTMREVAEVTQTGGGRHEAVREFRRRAQRACRSVQDQNQGIQAVEARHGSGSHPRRNRAAAQDAEAEPREEQERVLWYLAFYLGQEVYGLPLDQLREVARVSHLRRVPGAPAGVAGLVNLRGEILCALDVRGFSACRRRRRPTRRSSSRCRDFGDPLGLIVDSIADIYCGVAERDRTAAGDLAAERAACFIGTIRVPVGLMGLLDLARVTKVCPVSLDPLSLLAAGAGGHDVFLLLDPARLTS